MTLKYLGEASPHPAVISAVAISVPIDLAASARALKQRWSNRIYLDWNICFAVERKSIADLVGCCAGENRKRFECELHRLRGFRFKRLVVIGSESQILKGDYRSNIKPQAVMGTLRAFEVRYDVPVVFCETSELAGGRIESWAFWFAREMVEVVNALWRGSKNRHEQ